MKLREALITQGPSLELQRAAQAEIARLDAQAVQFKAEIARLDRLVAQLETELDVTCKNFGAAVDLNQRLQEENTRLIRDLDEEMRR